MRFLGHTSAIALILAAGLAGSSASAQTVQNLLALQGLSPFSALLNTSAGQAAVANNYTVTGAIQNGTSSQPGLMSFAGQQQQALKDAVLTTQNAYQLADGLGTKLGGVYQSNTSWTMTNLTTGAAAWTGISANVNNLIAYTYSITGSDSNSGKYFFANLTTNGATPVSAAAQAIMTAAGGTTDVFGKAYGLPGGSAGADAFGDSRPFQTLKKVITFAGTDYNGVASNSQYYLTGSTSASIYGQNLTNSPAWPSGHTTYGYTESLLLAMLVPQRYQQMITRGAEYGNSRIVLGAHYAMDVIAGRTLAYYDIAQMLANNPNYLGAFGGVTTSNYQTLFSSAQTDMTSALQSGCGGTLASCASQDTGVFSNSATNKAFYESTQTYGLGVVYQNTANTIEDVNKIAPEAGYLLMTRFPYLTQAQRNDVLTSTEGPGGGFLDNGSAFGLYSRLDLYMAAGGYGSFASDVNVTMNASLGGYNAADTWSNDISGKGGLTLGGTGALTLTGTDTYTGATIVNGGVLEVAGSIVSPTTVNSGGALAGAGSTGNVTVNSGGVLAPGALLSMGQLTINGALVFNAGSSLLVRATPTASDSVLVNGKTTVNGGTVNVAAGSGNYAPSTRYTLIDATGGVTGQFSGVTTNLAFLTPWLNYDANDVYLSLNRNNISFGAVAATQNQRAVGNGLTVASLGNVSVNGGLVLNAFYNLSAPQAQAALDATSGAGLATANSSALQTGSSVASAIADQGYFWVSGGKNDASGISHPTPALSYVELPAHKSPIVVKDAPAPERDWRVWGTFLGGGANVTADAGRGTAASNSSFYGGVAGLDYQVQSNWLVGAAVGGSDTHFNVSSLSTSGNTSAFHAGLYTAYTFGPGYYAQVSETFGSYDSSTKRYAGFGGLWPENLSGNFNSTEWRTRAEFGRQLDFGAYKVTPFIAGEFARLSTGSYSETGGLAGNALALSVKSQTTESAPIFLGAKLTSTYAVGGGWVATPNLSLAWIHEFSPDRNLSAALLSLSGSDFSVTGARAASNLAQVKFGGQLAAGNGFAVFAEFQGEFSSSSNSYAGKGGVKYNW